MLAPLLSAAALLAASMSSSAQTYTFINLGTPGEVSSNGLGINNAGQVVGYIETASGSYHATLWNGSTPTDLGTLGGSTSMAKAINNAGQVVGWSQITGGSYHATLWNGSTPIDLGTLGGINSAATAINNAGQVVGYSELIEPYTNSHAVLWNGTTPIDLNLGGGLSLSDGAAFGINEAGQIVGRSASRATLWNGTTSINLGTLSDYGGYSDALGIDNSGRQIVGRSTINLQPNEPSSPFHATLWRNGATPIDLGALGGAGSGALGVNNVGQIVGYSGLGATLWNGTVATGLNSFLDAATVSAGWYLISANAINDRGWITGEANNIVTNKHHAYLLVPKHGGR